MGVTLALDYGDEHIGLAMTDQGGEIALAHGEVAGAPEASAVSAIKAVVVAERVKNLVIGLPLTLDGREGAQAERTRSFADMLSRACGLPVEFLDERFTSADAKKIAAEKGTSPHAEAARLILASWLQRRRSRE